MKNGILIGRFNYEYSSVSNIENKNASHLVDNPPQPLVKVESGVAANTFTMVGRE